MPRGRPVKCIHCGSTDTTSKGARRTKTLGIRRIRRCRSCGRRFTPRHQKDSSVQGPESAPSKSGGSVETESVPLAEPAMEASVETESAQPVESAIVPSADSEAASDEHPRFGP
jgi:hypothetical protein